MQGVDKAHRAARAYADRLGWKVIPQRGKAPLTKHGVYDASSDPKQIDDWWAKFPGANIGISTGASGIIAVDFDGPAGRASLAALGALPVTPRQLSGGGGEHLIFLADERVRARQRVIPGVDVRAGPASLITVAPSIHPDTGGVYEWDRALHPLKVSVAPIGETLLGVIAPPEKEIAHVVEPPRDLTAFAKGALERACANVAMARAGMQEHIMHCESYSIGRLVGAGVIPQSIAISHLTAAGSRMANEKDKRPWGIDEIASKVRRSVWCGTRKPRLVEDRER